MAKDPLEIIGEALQNYWTSPVPLVVVFACLASMGTLAYVFLANGRNAKLRVSLLTGLYSLSIFFWLFVASSLVLCISLSRMVAYRAGGVQVAAGGAIFVSIVLSAAISFVISQEAAAHVLRKIRTRPLSLGEGWLAEYVALIGRFESLPPVEIRATENPRPLAMAVSGRAHVVVVSTGLLSSLDRDEAEAVVAHELMHIKNHDSRFKVFSTVASRVLFFDPFSKFFDPAVHREREYLADEMGGRTTGKPGALASALLKIHETGTAAPTGLAGLSVLGPEGGIFSRYPPLKERISRLVLLSEILARTS